MIGYLHFLKFNFNSCIACKMRQWALRALSAGAQESDDMSALHGSERGPGRRTGAGPRPARARRERDRRVGRHQCAVETTGRPPCLWLYAWVSTHQTPQEGDHGKEARVDQSPRPLGHRANAQRQPAPDRRAGRAGQAPTPLVAAVRPAALDTANANHWRRLIAGEVGSRCIARPFLVGARCDRRGVGAVQVQVADGHALGQQRFKPQDVHR